MSIQCLRKAVCVGESYIDIADDVSERLGLRLHMHEYQIVCALLDNDRLTPKELFSRSRLSSTGFFKTLNDMIVKGSISPQANPRDKRSKLYSLNEDVRKSIIEQFEFYRASSLDAFKSLGIENPVASIQSRHKIHKLPVKHLTCEYQIILYLYLRPGITYSQFIEIVGASETKFSSTLRELVKHGLVYFKRDPSDRRKKLYYVMDEVREALDDMHQRSFEWLDRRSSPANPQ